MRLKHYLIVAGFAAAALFGGSPAWADDTVHPTATPVPAECAGLPAEDGSAAPAEEPGAWAPGEGAPGGESGAGAEPCEGAVPPSEEPAPAPEDEAAEQEQRDREREIEEAAAPVPMPADPNYTG